MIKTIKVKKQMRLDELINYVFDSGIEDAEYHTSEIAPFVECEARISGSGNIKLSGYINKHTTFTVEVEELITEDTVFEYLVEVDTLAKIHTFESDSVGKMKDWKSKLFYALIDGRLELIWEREESHD